MASGKSSKRKSSRSSGRSGGTARSTDTRRMIFHAAEESVQFADSLRAHYRASKRSDVAIQADLRLLEENGTEIDAGTATIANVSPSGALLTDIRLKKGVYPTGPFKLDIRMKSEKYDGIGVVCLPVRLVPDQQGMGVKFEEIFVSL